MRGSTRYAAVFVATILANGAGANIGAAQNGPAIVTVTETQNGGTIELSKRQTLMIRLPAQLGTGFSWAIQRKEGISSDLVESGKEGGTGIPGAAETQVFVLKPPAVGNGEIELAYRRPWMRDVPPAKTFKLRVIIR